MQTELRPVEGYLENVLDFLQHSDIIRSCLIELNISEEKKMVREGTPKGLFTYYVGVHRPPCREGGDPPSSAMVSI